ncbi:MAG: HD domain-containing protein [Syntrophomonadaceae bacterium]|nr:HD domain-containing protein [Syntrophomonadaceae bacterium]
MNKQSSLARDQTFRPRCAKVGVRPLAKLNISLNEFVTALSSAIDLAEKVNRGHSLRTTYVASRISEMLGLSTDETREIYFASLLHDIVPVGGVFDEQTALAIHNSLFPLHKGIAARVTDIWHLKKRIKYKNHIPDNTHFITKIIYIGELFESMYSTISDEPEDRSRIRGWVIKEVKHCDVQIAAALLLCISKEAFWLDLRADRIKTVVERGAPDYRQYLDIHDVGQICKAFTAIIDRKNPYTGSHSEKVGQIAHKIAVEYGFDDFTIQLIEIAGYLHDLGKLAVPEAILNKPASLNVRERQIIQSHPYYTYSILGNIKGLEDIAQWAGNHHERLDGSGYPWGKRNLTVMDQIVAVSDIFEALTSARPYRVAVSSHQAITVLKDMVLAGKILGDVVEALENSIR